MLWLFENFLVKNHNEWAKQTKFLLAVTYERLDDIHTALKPLKKIEKFKYIFMIILGLAESFKTMNRPDPIVRLFDGLFLGKYDVNFWHNLN